MVPIKSRRWLGLAVLALVVVALGIGLLRRSSAPQDPAQDQHWPQLPSRVVVEVLNGGNAVGAARKATARLRRGGLDVVSYGNAGTDQRDTTRVTPLVLVRRSDTTGVGRIEAVLGPIEVRREPDPRPLVDITVVLGSDTIPSPN